MSLKEKIILLILTISPIVSIFSQNIILKGFVKDNLQNFSSNANIIAKTNDLKGHITFAISDEHGRYQLKLLTNKTYQITVSYLGYKTITYAIKIKENTSKDFILEEEKNQLDEVVIELPVTVKQDTIIYNTKYFVTGKERKLKNVLKKLPGIEVNKDGSITVQGKKVTKMLIDGKKFFNGGTKLAINNIPANTIDKVEVLDNYNEVAFLKSFLIAMKWL